MRDSHPGLFRAMVKTSGFALVNGVTMLLWPSRPPGWLPPPVLGIISVLCGIGIGAAALSPAKPLDASAPGFVEQPVHPLVVVGRVSLAILVCLCLVAAVGLYLGWDPNLPARPGTVTGSLDRVLLYGYVALLSVEVLREPTSNPVSAHRQQKG